MSSFMQNLNSNLLCAIDTETTGFTPGYHDMVQIAVIPLDCDLEVDKSFTPFLLDIIPRRPENADNEAMRINRIKFCEISASGAEYYKAAELFDEWFDRLKLYHEKRIMPLGCNWPFDRSFIMEWLGGKGYDRCFSPVFRDIQSVATAQNDRAGWLGQDFPYPKVNLQYLATQCGIERSKAHDATEDALVTAQVYKRLIQNWI